MTASLAITAVFVVAVSLRYGAQRLAGGAAVDQWYWRLYTKTVRSTGQFPPKLPQYLLDEHQWYPPVFPLILCAMPAAVVRAGASLSIALDLARLGLLLFAASYVGGGRIEALIIAGLVYATTPILVSYNSQLNPRALGALFLDAIGVLWLLGAFSGAHPAMWAAAVCLAAAVLLTHKMTTQLMAVLWLALGVARGGLVTWLALPAAVVLAWAVSGGFYGRVLRAHWDIVTFWNRNWRWLQANPVRESPIYGDAGYETPTRFYASGWPGVVRHVKYMFGFSPWAWLLPVAVLPIRPGIAGVVVCWGAAVLAFAVATIAVRPLRCLGSGYYYLYNAAFPVALAWALHPPSTAATAAVFAIAGLAALASIAAFLLRLSRLRKSPKADALAEVVTFLRAAPRGAVWCLPLLPSDRIACETDQPVLYGGHGYGFRLLEPIFPRITVPVSTICQRYDVRYIVTVDGYLPAAIKTELQIRESMRLGAYRILILAAVTKANTGHMVPCADASTAR